MAAEVAPAPGLLRVATRSSPQARLQAQFVADAIAARNPGLSCELVFVETLGDQRQDVPLHTIGGQGVFVKEVQRAVLAGLADVAVHSAKDLPSQPTEGLSIGAFTTRRDPRDALIGSTLAALAPGATVATGSVRRRAQLRALRPDLTFIELRGNINTRLTKIPSGGAIVMAVAALQVLDLTDRVAEIVELALMVPAVGQGCVAVEHRADDASTAAAVATVDDATARMDVTTERAFLAELGSGCSLPVGAHAGNGLLRAFLAEQADGGGRIEQRQVALAPGDDWHAIARDAAASMLAAIG